MIATIQVPTPAQGPSISSQIQTLEFGQKANAPISQRPYIGSLISGKLKYKYGSEREWITYINPDNDQLLTIERTK